jgi:hypothetical protein
MILTAWWNQDPQEKYEDVLVKALIAVFKFFWRLACDTVHITGVLAKIPVLRY